ncbi:MAG: gluconokinase [Deltaproteobacteria bacterium]|nr:gluconokinase [Deltaproteobacteria bacterium]
MSNDHPKPAAPVKDTPWFLGIDLGTGSCKSVVVDERANVLGFAGSPYQGDGVQERWQEQNPEELVVAVVASVRKAVAEAGLAPETCAGLSVGGALHSVMALDGRGNPLTGVITWADGRAVSQCIALRGSSRTGDLYRETGCPVHWMYPLYKIMWIRDRRPDVFRKTRHFVSAKEYVLCRLTGEFMADYSLAAGSGLLNTHTLRWSDLALDLAGIGEEKISSLHSPADPVGRLSPDFAGRMGIPRNTLVALGSSDAVNSSLGAGAVSPRRATCMVGTSGALRVISPRPVLDGKGRSWCYAIDREHWLVGGAINNGGVALSWLRDSLNRALVHLRPEQPWLSFEDVLRLAGEAKAGAGGLICLPFFAGERSPHWNLNARAAFFGLTLKHDIRHLSRALLEGIAFRFKTLHEMLGEIGVEFAQVIASGGFTRSDLWLQVVADALNRDLVVPVWGETSSLGAAFWPMIAGGALDSIEAAGRYVQLGKTCRPHKENAALYDRMYPIFSRLYQALEGSFDEVAGLQDEVR